LDFNFNIEHCSFKNPMQKYREIGNGAIPKNEEINQLQNPHK
jgi:hypothetical protein